MAAANLSTSPASDRGGRWKWTLLAFCAVCAIAVIASTIDVLGLGTKPWYGFWDVVVVPSAASPYSVVFKDPLAGGAAATAGIRDGDVVDLRGQSLDTRLWLPLQPSSLDPVRLVVQRGSRVMPIRLFGSSVWGVNAGLKVTDQVVQFLTAALFVGCALLIVSRRSALVEGRLLVIILLSQAVPSDVVFPSATASTLAYAAQQICAFIGLLLIVKLSSRFGARPAWRVILEWATYASVAVTFLEYLVAQYGMITLQFDPTMIGYVNLASTISYVSSMGEYAILAVAAIAAVACTSTEQRPRAAWLLLPLPLGLALYGVFQYLQIFMQTWYASVMMLTLASCSLLLGAIAVTFAILKRRVLDVEVVLSRTLGVAGVSLIVLSAFVLLEWLLGTALAGASHATGVIANAGLALILGVSLSFIHKRVERFIDATLFRKRHDDERALRNFAREAAFVTERDALLEQAIDKVRRHTDVLSAALYVNGTGAYCPIRSFGEAPNEIGENDAAILALKTWHEPLDPHNYDTAFHGALALPMMARGRLLGVLLCGEREGGVAYANDEVGALMEFAHGVGSALEAISSTDHTATERLQESILATVRTSLTSMQEAMLAELRTQPKG